jgi:uracil-DNA glycosylase
MDNMGERIATVSFKWQSSATLTYEMVGRRIMLEQGKPFVSGNDNTYLYFCGFSYANSETRKGDIVFGRISSKDLNSYANEAALILDKQNAIKIEIVFRYGSSTDTEYTFTAWNEIPNQYGDCALTADNANIVGVF